MNMKNLLFPFVFLLFTVFLLSFTFEGNTNAGTAKQIVGVFNLDSLLNAAPDYAKCVKTNDSLSKKFDSLNYIFNTTYFYKIGTIKRDSAKWNPLIISTQRKEADQLYERISSWQAQAAITLEQNKQAILIPLMTDIKTASRKIGNEKNYAAIIDNKNEILWTNPKITVVNITTEVAEKLGIKMK
jgi:Skp family chaperone for outer membrane proteins